LLARLAGLNNVYPKSLLFDTEDFVRYYPMVWLDMPQIWERNEEAKIFRQRAGYPTYYKLPSPDEWLL